jgi:hypothetical protein
MGSVAGTVYGLSAEPRSYTRMSAKAGSHRLISSVSWNLPSSHRTIAATDVIGLVIE